MDWTTAVFLICVGAFTALAAGFDLRTKKLPNRLTVPALAAAFLFHGATGGSSGLLTALGGFATGFGILLVLWIIGGGGGGDVKLMGALGAWLGPQWTLAVFFVSAALAALAGISLLVWQSADRGIGYVQRRYLKRSAKRNTLARRDGDKAGEANRRVGRRVLPYAVPVALSTWAVLVWNLLASGG